MAIREGRHDPPSRLAQTVRFERDRRKWTSAELSARAGVSHSWVRNFEAGIIKDPALDRVRRLEEAFKMRPGELYAHAIGISYDELIAIARADTGVEVPWDRLLDKMSALAEQQAEMIDLLRDNNQRLQAVSGEVDSALHGIESSVRRAVRGKGRPGDGHSAENAGG